jgi:hypothetical protein
MSFGGFMGLGHSHYPIPWSALVYDKSKGGFRTNITEQQLKDAPQFSDDVGLIVIGKPGRISIIGRPFSLGHHAAVTLARLARLSRPRTHLGPGR